MKIFLIGFMGCGKTYTGRQLAVALDYEFTDLDELIEKKESKTIAEIFEEHDEIYFRQKETVIMKTLRNKKECVIATGGGTPAYIDNMRWILQNGYSVYLKTSEEILFDRLKKMKSQRPLIKNFSEKELMQFIHQKLSERKKYYEMANITVDASAAPTEAILKILSEEKILL